MSVMSDFADIPFPYEPYPQQQELMKSIHNTLCEGKVGIFESPTGTGKSLSLICSVLYWQQEEEKRILSELAALTDKPVSQSSDWYTDMLSGANQPPKDASVQAREKLVELTKRIRVAKSTVAKYPTRPPVSTSTKQSQENPLVPDMEYLLDDYTSDDEFSSIAEQRVVDDPIDYSDLQFPRVYYCSRTHSQISQFVAEIEKTTYKSIRIMTLSSRKNYCIHDEVKSLSSDAAITERCMDMQKQKRNAVEAASKRTKSLASCPYYTHGSKQQAFLYKSLSEIGDLEALHQLGHKLECCPYYATRKAAQYAQVVCMSYNMMLQKDMREALHISLRNSIVIFDEGHNLVDAISQMHSYNLSHRHIMTIVCMVEAYMDRFMNILNGKNLTNLQRLCTIMKNLAKLNPGPRILTLHDFTFEVGIDNINITKLMTFMRENRLAEKVGGFAESIISVSSPSVSLATGITSNKITAAARLVTCAEKGKCINLIRNAIQFLNCLQHSSEDGRIAIMSHDTDNRGPAIPIAYEDRFVIKFILLNPSSSFDELVKECRSILILGGTMQPFSYTQTMLLPSVPRQRLTTFSCGHIVAPENVLTKVLTHFQETAFNFRHQTRGSEAILRALHGALSSLLLAIPNGAVVFFTSYKYMQLAVQQWSNWKLAPLPKPVLVEPSSQIQCDALLGKYTAACDHPLGACLLCVMGGKLSEGINFSDNLARAVIVVGMPYPDARDAVLQEKLAFSERSNPGSRQQIYESLCMKSVNQSIGRSIRHKDDFASIILLDERYNSSHIQHLLPSWIGENVMSDTLNNSISSVTAFFKRMKSKYQH